jgi:hypothetical protein
MARAKGFLMSLARAKPTARAKDFLKKTARGWRSVKDSEIAMRSGLSLAIARLKG